jgi:phosphoglucomutase
MGDLFHQIEAAVQSSKLLETSGRHIVQMLEQSNGPVYRQSIEELVENNHWKELDDRFFRTLVFGTGGLRGRTIGKIVTTAELGQPTELGRPQYPCVGTNAMNFYNISRATQGLVSYLRDLFAAEGRPGKPKIAIAHDTRHFSREFAELTARVATENGCDVCLFAASRSTPELSFAVRFKNATAGIVITASHNPPHDNGYKVYFEDGAQIVEPHAGAIVAKVNAAGSEVYEPLDKSQQGHLEILGEEVDRAYMDRLETLVLDRSIIEQSNLKIVFTSIHGTGGIIIKPMLERLGFRYIIVPEQEQPDGRFPTVKSPNPENAEALQMAMDRAQQENADLVMGTDPDCDRLGAAGRTTSGNMELFTGNQIGSLMAYYRVKRLQEQGVLTPQNAGRAVIVKTLVTSDLQKAIAKKSGMRCVETLTGFKYIGAKLGKYEAALPPEIRSRYRSMSELETRDARLRHSSYYVFGGEESYGYSGADFLRDKDGNGAAVMLAEVAAYAKSRGLTLGQLLDEIYSEFGYYFEKNGSITFEGAEGAAKIRQLITSYATSPPAELDGARVTSVKNFETEQVFDIEGDKIPPEKMMMFDLADGRRVAVRPSGTEPKIKFYMFAHRDPPSGRRFAPEELAGIKKQVESAIDRLWEALQEDAAKRVSTPRTAQ